MRNACLLAVLIFSLTVLGCAGVRLSVDYDTSADFTSFSTFDWIPEEGRDTGGRESSNPLVDARIRNAVENTLIGKGYVKADQNTSQENGSTRGGPDFLVAYFYKVEQKLNTSTVNTTFMYGRHYGGGSIGFQTGVSQYEEGTLVIDVMDARSKEFVWRGSGSEAVRRNTNPDKITRDINKAVSEILAKFPPKNKSGK